jgi:hypothetical protein
MLIATCYARHGYLTSLPSARRNDLSVLPAIDATRLERFASFCYYYQMQEQIATSNNGIIVTYDPVNSHAATHLEDTPQLKDLVKEVVNSLELTGQEIAKHYDMGRIVGTCDVVDVKPNDEIVYGIRKNRESDDLVPFVKNREGDLCPYVAVQLVPKPNGPYVLSSAWIGIFGEDDEPFPLAQDANERSIDFWNKHAFVYGSQEILAGSETKICPW